MLLQLRDLPSAGGSGSVARIYDVERLGLSSYFLASIFFLLLVYSVRQLRRIHGVLGTAFEPQKLFHVFVTTHCALRFVSFTVLSIFLLLKTDVWYPGLVMLFTLPEFFILSTYVLLYFLWLECYVFSHDRQSAQSTSVRWIAWWIVCVSVTHIQR